MEKGNNTYDEFKSFERKAPIVYAYSESVERCNTRRSVVCNTWGERKTLDLGISTISDYLVQKNVTNSHCYYYKLGNQYVVDAARIVRLSVSKRIATFSFDSTDTSSYMLTDLPLPSLKDLRADMLDMQSANQSPFDKKICLYRDNDSYWFNPRDVLYVISDSGADRGCFVKCTNHVVYHIPFRIGITKGCLNGSQNMSTIKRTSKFCIIQVDRLDREILESLKRPYVFDQRGQSVEVTDFYMNGESIIERPLSPSICQKYYNNYSNIPTISPSSIGSGPWFNFEICQPDSSPQIETNQDVEFVIEEEED